MEDSLGLVHQGEKLHCLTPPRVSNGISMRTYRRDSEVASAGKIGQPLLGQESNVGFVAFRALHVSLPSTPEASPPRGGKPRLNSYNQSDLALCLTSSVV